MFGMSALFNDDYEIERDTTSLSIAGENPRFVVDARLNFYKPGAEIFISIEDHIPPTSMQVLKQMGYDPKPAGRFTAAVGGMQAVVIDQETGTMTTGADPRRTGYAVGW
jgi:gamma-glutamyltranspeptidase/glutathione hydrolase